MTTPACASHPASAPIQAVVIAVKDDERTLAAASGLVDELSAAGVRGQARCPDLAGVRTTGHRMGAEGRPRSRRGRPPGPRLGAGHPGAARDLGEKTSLSLGAVQATVPEVLETIQLELMERARIRLVANTVDTTTPAEAREAAKTGFARIPWNLLGEDGERALNEERGECPVPSDLRRHPARLFESGGGSDGHRGSRLLTTCRRWVTVAGILLRR